MEIETVVKPDFKTLFESLPGLYMVLDPDLRIVAATDAYLHATITRRAEIVGRHVFEVFPDNPGDSSADAVPNSHASFNRVLKTRLTDAMVVQRHDVRRPECEGGGFEVRYWSPVNSPVLNPDGSLAYILHRVEDVTDYVLLKQQDVGQAVQSEAQGLSIVHKEADLYSRSRQVAETSLKLKRDNESLAGELSRRAGELQAVLDVAPVAVWIAHDPQCLRITGNAYADRILLQTGRGGNISRSAPPGDEAVSYRVFRNGVELRPEELPAQIAAATGRSVKEQELELVFAGGRVAHMLIGAVPLRDAQGSLCGSVAAGIDITARKLAETERDRLFEYSLDILCVVGFDGRFKRVSPSFARILGWNEEETLSRTIYDFIHPDDLEPTRKTAQTLQSGYEAVRFENRYRTREGLYRWISWSSHPIVEEGLIISVGRDITQRKRAEEALRQSEELLKTFVRNVPAAVAMLDRKMHYLQVSERWCADYALRIDGILGRSHYDVFPDLPERWKEIHRRCLAGETLRGDEDKWERAHGNVIWLHWEIRPWGEADGKPQGVLIFTEDITARKRMETTLRESEETIRTLLDTAAQAILAVDGRGAVVLANRMAEDMFGYGGTGLLGRPLETLLPERFRHKHVSHRAGFAATPRTRPMGIGLDLQGLRSDGTEFPIEISLSLVKTSQETLSVAFVSDVTLRKQAEDSLRSSERELRALAGNLLTAQEDERRRVARELHDDVTQRLAFLSIEIGKLANAVPSAVEVIEERLRSFQRHADQASDEVRRLSHGLHPSAIEDFGLSTALEEFCAEFAAARGIHLEFEGHPAVSGLSTAGAACLYRVAQECLRNIAKHAHASEVSLRLTSDGGNVFLTVTDNGAGFSVDARHLNTGLGLVSIKERVRMANGTLSITSQPGQGATIVVSVPLCGA